MPRIQAVKDPGLFCALPEREICRSQKTQLSGDGFMRWGKNSMRKKNALYMTLGRRDERRNRNVRGKIIV